MHGVCEKTVSGLRRENLTYNKYGKIVSKRKQALGKKSIKHLRALGYVAKRGTFKIFRKSMAKHSSKHASKKGKRHTRKQGGFQGADLKEAFETKQ